MVLPGGLARLPEVVKVVKGGMLCTWKAAAASGERLASLKETGVVK